MDNLSEEEAFAEEKKMISNLRGRGCSLVNLTGGGQGSSGCESKSRVQLFSMDKNGRIEFFPSIASAAESMKNSGYPLATRSGISAAYRGISICSYGRVWWKLGDNEKKYESNRDYQANTQGRNVYCSNGQCFPSLSHAARYLRSIGFKSANPRHISDRIRNFDGVSYGFKWSFDEFECHELNQATPRNRGREIVRSDGMVFPNAYAASEYMMLAEGVSAKQSNICSCANGRGKSAYGYGWKYAKE